jgi:hypothetical protein
VNGEPVFRLGYTPHPWMPDRQYKKLSLQEGANDVLLKVVNWKRIMSFSFMFYLGQTE